MSDSNKTRLNKDEFWKVIDDTNKIVGKGSQEQFLSVFREKLSEHSLEDIRDWYAIFRFYFTKAYRNDLWAACAATKTHCSDDGFIDFRYWLISQGREMYLSAINDPDSLADFDIPVGSARFELFGYEPDSVYGMKWDKENEVEGLGANDNEEFIDIWKAINIHPLSFEVVEDLQSDILERPDISDSWDYDELHEIVPRLYAKYNILSLNEKLESATNRVNNKIDGIKVNEIIKE